MKIYTILDTRRKVEFKASENNRGIMNMLFTTALSNWETKGSECWLKYCEKYPTIEQYDKHLDNLEKDERKEFFSNLLENNNEFNPFYKIVRVEEQEKESEI